MAYKWKPSASQRREFAAKMQDTKEQAAYDQRRKDKADKRREASAFNYASAGGSYVPSKNQHDYAVFDRSMNTTAEHDEACNMVASAFSCNEKCDHDYIHIVNELIRSKISVII